MNVIQGLGHRNYCTGTLIGLRQVLTAAHCLFDTRLDTWVKPQQVHFVAGQSRDGKFQAVMIVTDPDFRFAVEGRSRYRQVEADMVARGADSRFAWEGRALRTSDRALRRHCRVSDPWRTTPSLRANLSFRKRQGVTGHADGFPNRVTNKTVRRHPA
ncbi:MAG: trypsin-like serine protease, partial [Xanthobacteraceae bacterium]